jgi:hypothetical protein
MSRGPVRSRRDLSARLVDAANCSPGNDLHVAFLAAANEAIRVVIEELKKVHADPEESYSCAGTDWPCAIEDRIADLTEMVEHVEEYDRHRLDHRGEELRIYRGLETELRAYASCATIGDAARHRHVMQIHLDELDRLRGIAPLTPTPTEDR